MDKIHELLKNNWLFSHFWGSKEGVPGVPSSLPPRSPNLGHISQLPHRDQGEGDPAAMP